LYLTLSDLELLATQGGRGLRCI